MLSALSRWLTGQNSTRPARYGKNQNLNDQYRFQLAVPYHGDLESDDIPRYPPFAKGFPVTPVDVVLESQRKLILRLQRSLGMDQTEFETLLLPVLRQYASFVHQLPASEQHHHRGAGGLIRHGLEVAFWAAQSSEASIFNKHDLPKRRKHNEQRWRLAVALAGLMHDVGKPITDVTIVNKSGDLRWNPYSQTLVEWARENQIERYFLRWNRNRYRRHEEFAHYALTHVMPREIISYLSEAGEDIIREMQGAIFSANPSMVVGSLVLKADQISVARDLEANNLKVDEFADGVTVEPYVIDAIRRLVRSGRWKSNEVGAAVWVTTQGLFLNWRMAAADVVELLDELDIPGVPRDADTLADLLIQRGAAIGKPVKGAPDTVHPYWEVQPKLLQEGEISAKVTLLMLRLASVSQLYFNTDPPEAVEAEIMEPTRDQPTLVIGNGGDAENVDAEVADAGKDHDAPEPEILAIDRVSVVPLADMLSGLTDTSSKSKGKGGGESARDAVPDHEDESGSEDAAAKGFKGNRPDEPGSDDEALDQKASGGPWASLANLGLGVGMDMPFDAPGTETETQPKIVAEPLAELKLSPDLGPVAPSVKSSGKGTTKLDKSISYDAVPFGPLEGLDALMPQMDEGQYDNDREPDRFEEPIGGHDFAPTGNLDLGPSKAVPRKKKRTSRSTTARKPAAVSDLLAPTSNIAPATFEDVQSVSHPISGASEGTTPAGEKVTSREETKAPTVTSATATENSTPGREIDWSEHGDAGVMLGRLAEPLFNGETSLGEALYLSHGQLAILFPQGVEAIGDAGEVLAVLDRAGLVDTAEGSKDNIVTQIDGLELVLLQGELADRILTTLKRLADLNEPFDDSDETASVAELEASKKSEMVPAPKAGEGQGMVPEIKPGAVPAPEKTLAPSQETDTEKAEEKPESKPYPQYTLPAPKTRKSKRGNKRGSTKARETKGPTIPVVRDFLEPIDEPTPTKDQEEMPDPFEGLGPTSTLDPLEALRQLTAMIQERSGDWLVTDVVEENGWLRTSDKAFDAIAGRYPMLSKSKLRLPLMLKQFPAMKHANGYLYVRIEDE